jgi:O-antigen biosynthesis protein
VDICFASDQNTLARLNLNHRRAFQADPGADLIDLALAYGNNALARRVRYSQTTRCRDLPAVYIPAHRRLRVLLQVDNFTQGGLEQAVIDLAVCLQNNHFQVYLLVLGERGESVSKLEETGVAVLTLPDDRRVDLYRCLLTEKQIDLVNAHYSLFGAETAAALNIPFVQTIHNSYVWLSTERKNSFVECDSFTTAYVCVSHNAAFYSDVRLQLPPAKMVIIPNGIDASRFEAAPPVTERQRMREELGLMPDDYVFLNVASIYPPKAQRFAVQALARVRLSHPNAKLVLVGRTLDEHYEELIKKDIESGGLTHAVIFVGYRENIIPFYWMADAFLLPSFWEGWSLALAEALYAHLPTVATDVGAARELLSHPAHRIIQPPFVDITDLDSSNMNSHLEQDHATFVQDLADTMESVCMDPSSSVPPDLGKRLDRREAYASYSHLFHWLIQGGDPISARTWTRTMPG